MKTVLSTILSIFLIVGNSAFAEDPVVINKDDKAPFTGLLFSTEKANEMKYKLQEGDAYKDLYESSQRSLNLMNQNLKLKDEQIDIVMNQNNKLALSLREQRDFNSWERIGWFALGVVATSLAVYGVKQATR